MLCCVSRKASAARPTDQNHQNQLKPIDSDCSRSSSGFSESSSASSGDFASSGFSATSSSSSTTSGFSSTSPPSLCAFSNSSSSGSEFSDRFDVHSNYFDNPSNLHAKFTHRAVSPPSSSSFSSCSDKGIAPVSIPKRLQTFSTPPASLQKRSNSGNVIESIVGKDKSAEDEPPALSPCAICARTFLPQSLEKHTRICERSAIKKRKPFDSAKQRIQGTELAEFLPKETIKRKVYQEEKPVPTTVASKGSWKQTHDEFLRAIRAARGDTIDVPAQRQVVAPSHVTFGVPTRPNEKGMCPTCNRQFSIKSYERHVAWCKDHATRVPLNPATNVAKERLEARMNYRAPLLKNRKLTNRDKYSPGSAVNLPNYGSKNTLTNNRAKESASSPNCNNSKGGNEATMGSGNQYHQKATATASRHSGQSREGMSSGPIKSRPSDRSSRPSAEIESGPTTIPSSCPVPPRTNNAHQHFRLSPTKAIPPSNSTSPLSTARSVGSRITTQEPGSSRRFGGNDRKAIELNIFDGAKHHQRLNIVSARSNRHPKVNDVAINDEVIGMTVQRCGVRQKNEKEVEKEFITWKQISEENNLAKLKYLRLNDDQNSKRSKQQIEIADSGPFAQNEVNCNFDYGFFGTKKLNQTYLIRESLDAEANLSQILDRRIRRPVVNSPRVEFDCTPRPPMKNENVSIDMTSPSRFNAEVNVTSSPLQSPGSSSEGEKSHEKNVLNRVTRPGTSELAKLDLVGLEIRSTDEDSDQYDTSTSEAAPLLTCRRPLVHQTPRPEPINRYELICENLINRKSLEKRNFEDMNNSRHSLDPFQGLELNVSRNRSNEFSVTSGSEKNTPTTNNNCNRSSTNLTLRMNSKSNEIFDSHKQLNFQYDNRKDATTVKPNINKLVAYQTLQTNSKTNENFDSDKQFSFEYDNRKDATTVKPNMDKLVAYQTLKTKSVDRKEFDGDKRFSFESDDEQKVRITADSSIKDNCTRSLTEQMLKISMIKEQVDLDKQSSIESSNDKNSGNTKNSSTKDNCGRSLTEETLKMSFLNREEVDNENQLNCKSCNEKTPKSEDVDASIEDIEPKISVDRRGQVLDTSSSLQSNPKSTTELKVDKPLDCRVYNEDKAMTIYSSERIEDAEIREELDTSRNPRLKKKRRSKFRNHNTLHSGSYTEQTDARAESSSESIGNAEGKTNTENDSPLSATLVSFERTETLAKTLYGSSKKDRSLNESITQSGGRVLDIKSSESSDVENHLALIGRKQSFQDFSRKINNDGSSERQDTPRFATTVVTPINSSDSSSPTRTPNLSVRTELSFHKLVNDDGPISGEGSNDSSMNRSYPCVEAEAHKKVNQKEDCGNTLETELSSFVKKVLDVPLEAIGQSLVQPVELLANSSKVEQVKDIVIEQPKNYRRCGTYVIERATNPHHSTKHSASDESLKEKPASKKRKTEQSSKDDEIEKPSISNEALEEDTTEDIKPEQNLRNFQNSSPNSLLKPESGPKSKNSKIKTTDRNVHEIHEKYVNCNFDYDSDNTAVDNNSFMNSDPDASKGSSGKMFCPDEISSYDLQPKALSDSIVPRQKSSGIPTMQCHQNRFAQDPAKMKKKLKKKMTLLRGSIETLISSVEASGQITDEKSSGIVNSCEIDKTPLVVEEAIQELDYETAGKITASSKTYSSFLPEILIDRVSVKSPEINTKKCCPTDGSTRWEKAIRNSNKRLINLDLPNKCQETRIIDTRQSNVGNLFPAIAASFKKEKRRSSDLDYRAVWSNYVRRRPDFNLVLTGRTGSCKDYDPFLLAERQMNELLSDTCSDQSCTDSPANRRRSLSPSAPNYPLSHSSAFVKYPDPLAKNLNNSDKRTSLLAPPSEFDDLTADFSSDSTETNSISREMLADLGDSRARENGFDHQSKSNHVLGRRVIIDKSKALGTNEINGDSVRKNSQTNEKARKILDRVTPKVVRPHITRSSSVRANSAPKAPERKNNNLLVTATNKINSRSNPGSGFNNRNNNYTSLSGSNVSLSSIVSSEIEVKRSNSLFDELVSSFEDDASGSYPSLGSLLKNDSLSVNSPAQQSNRPRNGQISDDELLSSPDSYQRQDHNKLSADSAYSSLNRKYSNHGRSTNDGAGRLDEDLPHRRRDSDGGLTSSAKSKLSKFCHECGCKFPETAKFCCECGIKRLAL